MHLVLNGEPNERPEPCSLAKLLQELNIKAERVTTVVNDAIVPAAQRAAYQVREGDRIEILTFAGGG
ncbi:MAG: sulfur carrier protein ThiS [Lentisphaerae bacterium]|nr:sulfur carrier protein ThiS [Lentisphaerota bacterium]